MTVDDVRFLFAYDRWATGKVLEAEGGGVPARRPEEGSVAGGERAAQVAAGAGPR